MLVKGATGNKLQEGLNQNDTSFIQENYFEYVIYEMMPILSRPQYVLKKCFLNLLIGLLDSEGDEKHRLWKIDVDKIILYNWKHSAG